MNYDEAMDVYETLSEDYKTKEVYAHFGLAIFFAQILEQQLINMLILVQSLLTKFKSINEFHNMWDDYSFGKRTLGKLQYELKKFYELSDEDTSELGRMISRRNFIAHDYFKYNSGLFLSDDGKKRMIKDFIDFKTDSKKIDSKLQVYMNEYLRKAGITDKVINNEMEKYKTEWKDKQIDLDFDTMHKI